MIILLLILVGWFGCGILVMMAAFADLDAEYPATDHRTFAWSWGLLSGPVGLLVVTVETRLRHGFKWPHAPKITWDEYFNHRGWE